MDSIADILGLNSNSAPPASHAHDDAVIAPQNLVILEPKKETEIKDSGKKIDIEQIKKIVYAIKDQLDGIIRVFDGDQISNACSKAENQNSIVLNTGERVIEGVFNGEKMIGPDGAEYSMPPNYASKSKLVEGDNMKLTITKTGSFIYKQIKQVDRKKVIGTLEYDVEKKKWTVLHENRHYKVLTASISFYKGKAGDEAVIIIPLAVKSEWGAVDNIISK